MGSRLRRLRSELTAESMRPATLVGLAAVPAGFLWIALSGSESAGVLVLAGVLVGVLYSDRPTPAHRAGARAGLFAPIPLAVVLASTGLSELWATSAGLELKVAVIALVPLGVLKFWILGAALCVVCAAVTALVVDRGRSLLGLAPDPDGR